MIDFATARRRRLALSLLTGLLFSAARGWTADIESARVQQIAGWLTAEPAGFGRPIGDRGAWERLGKTEAFGRLVLEAERLAKTPLPDLPESLYLDFSKTGNRDRCQRVLAARDGRLVTFTLAECVENRGRFIAPLIAVVEAICKERTWVYPAHDRALQNFNGKAREMDLRATLIAWELANLDYVLGEKLPPQTRQLIRREVAGRVLNPFREMLAGERPRVHWIAATHNWNAVCLAGITGAALALEPSPQDRAWFIAAAETHIRSFLRGFTPDGYCSEGIGYWNYGFGRFLMLTESIRQATGGQLDLLADPAALQPALFCTRTEILNGIYPTIADCHPGSRPDPQLVRYICERLKVDLPQECNASFLEPSKNLSPTLMFTFLREPLPAINHGSIAGDSPLRTWFTNGGVLICRPLPGTKAGFAVALKGGHNAEHHNHNDVGSFSVVTGNSMVICDPGSEVYTARTFGSHRYDSKVLSSFGHAVPVLAGKLQEPGSKARAVVLRTDFTDTADTLALDIRSAYPAPELQKLERTFTFNRTGGGSLSVRDDVAFSAPKTFETALVTWGRWQQTAQDELSIRDDSGAVHVRIETGGRPFTIRSELLDEDVPTRTKPTRIGISLNEPLKEGRVTFRITPDR